MPPAETSPTGSAFRVLVVEDEFMIAMELDAVLSAGGFEVIGPVPSVAAALHRLQAERPDAAVLDVSLRGERATPVAQVLLSMNVPFVLASAYSPADLAGDPALASARNLGKPITPALLVGAMEDLRGRARDRA